MNGLKLTKLRLEGFRSFKDSYNFDFSHNIIIIYGPNGTGKTSILDAIEFGLFGKIERFKGEEFTLTRDEIINVFTEKKGAQVEIWLKDNDNIEYYIQRKKNIGIKKTQLIFRKLNKIYKNKNAQDEITKLLQM